MRPLQLAVLAALMLPADASWAEPAATAPAEILETIQRRVTRFLRATVGIASTRRVVTRVYDPDDNRLLKTTRALQEHVFYHHRLPSIRILDCSVDGQKRPAGDCDSRFERNEPHFPVFGPTSAAHYRISITGQARCGSDLCHRVQVRPTRRSVRHFQGTMLFRVGDLLLRQLEGGVSHLPFPVQHLFIKLHFEQPRPDIVAVSRGYLDVWVRIPLLYERRFVTRFEAFNSRAVPRTVKRSRPVESDDSQHEGFQVQPQRLIRRWWYNQQPAAHTDFRLRSDRLILARVCSWI